MPRYQAIERWQTRDGLCPHLIVERIAIVEEICEIEQQGWIVGRRSRLEREGVHQQVGGFDGSAPEEEVQRVSGGCDDALAAGGVVALAGVSRAKTDSAAARCWIAGSMPASGERYSTRNVAEATLIR